MKVVKREDRIRAVDGLAVFVVHDEPQLIRDTMLEDVDVPFPCPNPLSGCQSLA